MIGCANDYNRILIDDGSNSLAFVHYENTGGLREMRDDGLDSVPVSQADVLLIMGRDSLAHFNSWRPQL